MRWLLICIFLAGCATSAKAPLSAALVEGIGHHPKQRSAPCQRDLTDRSDPVLVPAQSPGEAAHCLHDSICRDGYDLLVLGHSENGVINLTNHCVRCQSGTVDRNLTDKAFDDHETRRAAGCRDGQICVVCR